MFLNYLVVQTVALDFQTLVQIFLNRLLSITNVRLSPEDINFPFFPHILQLSDNVYGLQLSQRSVIR